ncbi:hypothetical protein A374_00240 [Fictibacillus macauensis ZFHKF-1]|uniref:VanZ-like domain-containing protein n=1 Tax=Fictibacillus macauensis ZFHKF-1 TaxID=1196324 RepID=I8ANQ1_9BACL|nr:VanZ family protein [Fictibacillus macauensis]EIT87454.1 hypothetical protein A374_00240 [Fictibacillus macauensis ZFHKF-1]
MEQLWRAFQSVIPLFIIGMIVMTITAFYLKRTKKWENKKLLIQSFFILSVLGILLVTLFPGYSGMAIPRVLNIVPFVGMYDILFHSVDAGVPIRNLGFNMLLFVPFGFFLSLKQAPSRVRPILIAGLLFSLAVEIAQYAYPTGRSADIDDVILNTVGTWIGYTMWRLYKAVVPNHVIEKEL